MNNQETGFEQKAMTKNGVKRMVFALFSILLEVLLILSYILWLNNYAEWISIGTRILAAVLVLSIYNKEETAAMKMPWIILIMILPVFGATFYLLVGLNSHTRKMRKSYDEIDAKLLPLLPDGREALSELEEQDQAAANIAKYISTYGKYPIYHDTKIDYYPEAELGLEAQKQELRKAQKFIFMEYHAIEDAQSWHGIQEILEERVKAGVEVRVFYDDMGSIGFINTDFVKRLEAKGIRCKVFNPFGLGLNIFLNNRDHRKITVIDGKVGFTGGYNLANEYFGLTQPYGKWKDTGIKLTGNAVKSLTVAFLEMWNASRGKEAKDTDFTKYLPDADIGAKVRPFVQPYADSPMDDERLGEDVYISVAEYAKEYAWFITPYLILTDEMSHALSLAAKRGVDVRVITPGIPDKKMVYSVTRSYYHNLVKNGVRVYEFTPGFCHCKMSVADDRIATCGTINLDYRSLYHHFENGCLYYGCKAVTDTRKDFESILAQCREVSEEYKDPKVWARSKHVILRLIAPLL